MNWQLNNQQCYVVVFLLALLLCASNIWGYPIYILDEAKNSEAAREMLKNQQWFVPTFNNELRTDKPPLHYFFMMLSYELFGVNAFSARLFSSIFGALTMLSCFYFVKKFAGKQLAVYTLGVLFASVFFLLEFHLAVPDPYLIFFVSFALFNFYDFHLHQKRISWFLFYTSIGLAVLAKGPIAIALPGLIVLIFLFTNPGFRFKDLFRYKPFLGGLLTLVICVPWFLMAHWQTFGEFSNGFFIKHNIQRFGSEMEGHGGWFFVTWLFVLLGLLPFSFFVVQSLIKSYQNRKAHSFLRFCLVVVLVWIGFFSISSTKLPNYPMPSYPFLAVVIAHYCLGIMNQTNQKKLKWYKISLWIMAVIGCLLPIAGYIALRFAEQQLSGVSWVSGILLIVLIGSVLSLVWFYKNKVKQSFWTVVGAYVLLNFGLFFVVFPKITSQSPVELAKTTIESNKNMLLYKSYDPAFLINYKKTFLHVESKMQAQEWLKKNPNAYIITKKKYFESDFTPNNYKIILEQKALFENYTTIIFAKK